MGEQSGEHLIRAANLSTRAREQVVVGKMIERESGEGRVHDRTLHPDFSALMQARWQRFPPLARVSAAYPENARPAGVRAQAEGMFAARSQNPSLECARCRQAKNARVGQTTSARSAGGAADTLRWMITRALSVPTCLHPAISRLDLEDFLRQHGFSPTDVCDTQRATRRSRNHLSRPARKFGPGSEPPLGLGSGSVRCEGSLAVACIVAASARAAPLSRTRFASTRG